jgi:membrane protein DedA with SNARE-associated domain
MLEQLLHDFGYLALFLGTFFEGETILVLAGFLAFREYLTIELVILVAFLGSYSGDQLWYFLGRRHGRRILERRPQWNAMSERALNLIRRHPDLWVLGFRFVYGLRTVMPVAIGMSGYPPLRYLLLNGLGAVIWAVSLGLAAYHFSAALEGLLGDIKRFELYILGGLALLGLALWLRRRYKARNKAL